MTAATFLKKFENGTLARADWTHEAHVRMAWLYVTRTGSYREARNKVRTGIKKLNSAFQARDYVPCGATRPEPVAEAEAEPKRVGYHETITTGFVRLVAARVREGENFATFRRRNPDLFDGKLSALLTHYSVELLFSDAARNKFVEPDLKPAPKPWLARV